LSTAVSIALQGAPDGAQTFEFEEDSTRVLGVIAVLTVDVTTPGIHPADNDLYTVEMKPDECRCSILIKPSSPLYSAGVMGFAEQLRKAVASQL